MMEPVPTASGHELRELLGMIRAHKFLAAFLFLVVVGGIMTLSYRQLPLYRSEVRVLVEPILAAGPGSSTNVNLDTQVQLVQSAQVAEAAAEELGTEEDPTLLLTRVDARGLTSTEVLIVGYTAPTASGAKEGADAFAKSYLEFRAEEALNNLEASQEILQEQLQSVRRDMEKIIKDINQATLDQDASLLAVLETQRSVLAARVAVLEQNLDQLQPQAGAVDGGEIIQEAYFPSRPSRPDHRRDLILALIAGGGIAFGGALLKERLDDRLRGKVDLQRAAGAPVLALIPRFSPEKLSGPAVIADPEGQASEAFRTLRTGIQFLGSRRRIKSILITSPSPGEGKTLTAVNLSLSLAQSGQRVILVVADLRRPSVGKHIPSPPGPGLAEWLVGRESEPYGYVQDPGIPNLRIIPSGHPPPNPAELLASPRLGKLVAELEDQCDFIVFDSPPVLAVADASIVASHVDGTILVVNAASTLRSSVTHARDELERLGANIVGAVLNGFKPGGPQGGYYSYYGTGPESSTKAGKHSRPGEAPRYVARG